MAVSSLLPPECSLQPESDDEESFVVLGHSLPPESIITVKDEPQEIINPMVVERSIDLITSALALNSHNSLPPSPMPKDNEEISLTNKSVSVNTCPEIHSTELSPDEIQHKVDFLVEENMKLKETLHQNNLAMKKQYETIATWQEDALAVHSSHKQKFDDIKKYVEKLKVDNAKLSSTLAATVNGSELIKTELQTLKLQQKEAKDQADMKNSFNNLAEFELESAKKKIAKLESMLLEKTNECEDSIAATTKHYTTELEKLKSSSEKQISELSKQRKESEALQKILLDEVKSLKAQLLAASGVKENERNFEEQLMAAQMHITNLELCRNEDRDTINANEEKILELENKVKELNSLNDTVSALHAQLEIYKLDFEAERHAKEEVGVEKEKIAQDLHNLQRRNQQLLEEVERLRGNDYVYVAKEEQASAPQETHDFRCPKCNRRFVNYPSVERHVFECIDELF